MLYKLSKGVNKLANKKDINENINESDKVFRKVVLSWYPGHMARAKREIGDAIKQVDIVIELLDARIPIASRNPVLNDIIGNKPRLLVLNKADLADKKETEQLLENMANDQNLSQNLEDI